MIELVLLMSLAFAETNTNKCLDLLKETKNCFSQSPNIQTCCPAVKLFNENKCFCNNLALSLSGAPNTIAISKMLKICGAVPISCVGFDTKTYSAGKCSKTDVQLDAERLKAAETFANTILSFPSQTACFDYKKFRTSLESILDEKVEAYAGQGLGIYIGIDHVAEYFSLLSPMVNKRFVSVAPAAGPAKIAYINPDGNSMILGINVVNKYLNSAYQRDLIDYLESAFTFQDCSSKVIRLELPSRSRLIPGKLTGVVSLTEMLYLTVNSNHIAGAGGKSFMGFRSTCRQHNKYCVGENKQFEDGLSCLKFLRNLPKVSPACGAKSLGSGNTGSCRAKHQFMVQISPDIHCQHIGPSSTACNESKCDVPGIGTDVKVNLSKVGSKLATALKNMNDKLQVDAITGNWTNANYC